MTLYFFDEVANKLIAYDRETKAARELESIAVDGGRTAKFTEEQLFPIRRKKGTKVSGPARKSSKGCPECGSPSRHKKDCSRSSGSAKPAKTAITDSDGPRAGAMSRMNFGRVKIAEANDIPIRTIANNLDVTEDEVNKAIEAETFDEYLGV